MCFLGRTPSLRENRGPMDKSKTANDYIASNSMFSTARNNNIGQNKNGILRHGGQELRKSKFKQPAGC